MNGNRLTAWVEGTAEDLVADALALEVKASPRMVTSWIEDGLLANPEPRKTSAHGSDPRVFPREQRELFARLLEARKRSPLGRIPQRSLVRVVLYLWLIDDTVVSSIMSTHELESLFAVADRLLFLDVQARTATALGPPSELRDHGPAAVREFLTRGQDRPSERQAA